MGNYTVELALCVLNGLLIPAIIFGAKYIAARIIVKQDKLDKLEKGMLATLRQQYLTTAFCYIEKGWMPLSMADSMEKIYEAYHGLGGNSTVTNIRETVIKLPRKA